MANCWIVAGAHVGALLHYPGRDKSVHEISGGRKVLKSTVSLVQKNLVVKPSNIRRQIRIALSMRLFQIVLYFAHDLMH